MTPDERKDLANAIGVWTIRGILAIGAVVCGCLGKEDAAGGCVVGLIVSFWLLD